MGEPQGRQYGQIDIDSNRYLAGPALPGRRLLAAVRWDSVQITDPGTGEIVAGYPRIYGRSPSTLQDPELAMPVLAAKPGSWGESSIRPDFPEDVRAWLDEADSKRLAQSLRSIGAACAAAGFGNAVAAASRAVYGQINVYGVTTKSERYKRSYWTRTAAGNGIGGRKAPVPYGS